MSTSDSVERGLLDFSCVTVVSGRGHLEALARASIGGLCHKVRHSGRCGFGFARTGVSSAVND
jgi:hypothetical protein